MLKESKSIHLFSTSIKYSGFTSNIKSIGEMIYIYDSRYNGNAKYTEEFTTVNSINLTKKNQSYIVLPNPGGLSFSVFYPNKNMDITNSNYFIADYDNYRILSYDTSMQIKDSIIRKPIDWIKSPLNIPVLGKNSIRNFIDIIRPYTGKTSLIRSIDLFSDDRMLVSWTKPNGEEFGWEYRYDLWKLKQGENTLIFSDCSDFEENPNSILNKYSVRVREAYRIVGDYLITIINGTTNELFNQNIGNKYSIYQENCDTFFSDSDIKSLVFIYKLKD